MSIPSLRALRAFAEVARAGSLAEAARELHVSPSAGSHLLWDLEAALGFSLFVGRGSGAPLSEQRARLARRLGGAFETIEMAGDEARHRSGDVRVSALTSFSTLWLVPRLPRLQARRPDMRLFRVDETIPAPGHRQPCSREPAPRRFEAVRFPESCRCNRLPGRPCGGGARPSMGADGAGSVDDPART
jgi:Bacterial regulatory helix-turn-helix protein, lysR family